ncbi:1497_t:CDS:2 [Ambispora gerdemannii]|uniref:1497_t:CDS:1 n=1 Tax=Ambispora gerdemannii TaxID=144530 RepID=A0A9N8UXT2_9GLOM|nr:1497_t:CDS:2 [Ambispora gerdemannii]
MELSNSGISFINYAKNGGTWQYRKRLQSGNSDFVEGKRKIPNLEKLATYMKKSNQSSELFHPTELVARSDRSPSYSGVARSTTRSNGCHERLLVSAIKEDIDLLLSAYQQQTTYDFTAFKKIWTSLNFEVIHFAAHEKTGREVFMQTLFQLLLDKYNKTRLLETKLGAIYAMYLLYYTQPKKLFDQVIRIRVTLDNWKSLFDLFQYCKKYKIHDFVYIYNKLKTDSAWVFVAVADPCYEYGTRDVAKERKESVNEFQPFPKELSQLREDLDQIRTGSLENPSKLAELQNLSLDYYNKRDVICGTVEEKAVGQKKYFSMLDNKNFDIYRFSMPLKVSNMEFLDGVEERLARSRLRRSQSLAQSFGYWKKQSMAKNNANGRAQLSSPDMNAKVGDNNTLTSYEIRNNLRHREYTQTPTDNAEKAREFSLDFPPAIAKKNSSLSP